MTSTTKQPPTRLAEQFASANTPGAYQPVSLWTWAKIIILGGLIVWLNHEQFVAQMFEKWVDDVNWSHGFLIPLFSLYLLYIRYDEIRTAERKVCWWGILPVAFFGYLQVYGYKIQNPWSCQLAMLFLSVSLILFLGGRQMFRLLWLPILFMAFAMPIPGSIYNVVALKLQNIAAAGSTGILEFFGTEVLRKGSTIYVMSRGGLEHPLRVEEACSGLRLLMAFMALSVAMAYMADRPVWQRVVLVLMGIPVAIASNVLRVTFTCLMFVIDKRQFGEDAMHEFTGMLTLIPAALMLWGIAKIMDAIFIEGDEDEDEDADAGDTPAAPDAAQEAQS